MKYQLLWTACVIGLLQLSVVTCRRAHDKVTNKENEEYSTTVSPPVAYTGQEIERALNSSDKLALDPGLMSSDTDDSSSVRVWIALVVTVLSLILMIIGCICRMCRRCNEEPQQVVTLQNGGQMGQVQNFPQGYNPQWQQPNMPINSPPPYAPFQQYQQQPQPLPQYQQQPQPLPQYQQQHHLPHQHQQQVISPTNHSKSQVPPMQAQTQQSLPVAEFENPLRDATEASELPKK